MESIFHEKQPSGNMDDSGFFSIQTAAKAATAAAAAAAGGPIRTEFTSM
ncbi:ataxin-3 isoform j [Homo sapiens]|nr:ataxin-3 isoform j [Homo sapiens]|eukprot:NP_001158249.1 ataxin-3 isoform j [Homo sapiens]